MGLEGIITNKQALPTPLRHQGMPHNGSQWCRKGKKWAKSGQMAQICPNLPLRHHCDPLYGISWRRNGVGRACLFVMEAWEAIARLVKIKTVAGVTWGRASFALSGHCHTFFLRNVGWLFTKLEQGNPSHIRTTSCQVGCLSSPHQLVSPQLMCGFPMTLQIRVLGRSHFWAIATPLFCEMLAGCSPS